MVARVPTLQDHTEDSRHNAQSRSSLGRAGAKQSIKVADRASCNVETDRWNICRTAYQFSYPSAGTPTGPHGPTVAYTACWPVVSVQEIGSIVTLHKVSKQKHVIDT